MTVFKYDNVIKKSRDIGYYFGIFERSYLVLLFSTTTQGIQCQKRLD